jgi:Reverse transcriptase (RNA-dependent DNA polymerase)
LIGFQEIGCHIVFDVKMDLARKARFVAGGHTTDAPAAMTYSSVVSRDSVRLAFLLAALNGIDIMSCDLENAYLNAPCKEKIWFEGGTECGEDKGCVLVVIRAFYGLRSAGASWRTALAKVLADLEFKPTRADPDVWIRAAVKTDGFRYYEMVFVYVNDVLASHKAKEV